VRLNERLGRIEEKLTAIHKDLSDGKREFESLDERIGEVEITQAKHVVQFRVIHTLHGLFTGVLAYLHIIPKG
jgi:hypothetical protein